MIDCNCALGSWPFRTVLPQTAEQLTDVMARCGLTGAWVSALKGVFHKDIGDLNHRLLEEIKPYPQLTPVGVLNPNLPGWEHDGEQLRVAQVPGVRLYPNYHQYSLSDESCLSLLGSLPEGTFAQIVVRMVDERRQHPLCQVPPTDLQYLPELAVSYPGLSFVVCNANNAEIIGITENTGTPDNVWFEISHVEGVNGVADLLSVAGEHRLLLGTHMPLFYPESSLLKLAESDLTPDQLAAIKTDNARKLLRGRQL